MQCMYTHKMCTVMNGMNRLKLLLGREFTNIATDSKKDDCTELENVTASTNPCETDKWNNIVTVKINARVMITTNIDVTDGLKMVQWVQ